MARARRSVMQRQRPVDVSAGQQKKVRNERNKLTRKQENKKTRKQENKRHSPAIRCDAPPPRKKSTEERVAAAGRRGVQRRRAVLVGGTLRADAALEQQARALFVSSATCFIERRLAGAVHGERRSTEREEQARGGGAPARRGGVERRLSRSALGVSARPPYVQERRDAKVARREGVGKRGAPASIMRIDLRRRTCSEVGRIISSKMLEGASPIVSRIRIKRNGKENNAPAARSSIAQRAWPPAAAQCSGGIPSVSCAAAPLALHATGLAP